MEHVNAEILRAIADGKKVQYRNTTSNKDGTWKDFDKNIEACSNLLTGHPVVEWRVAPKTVKIGDFEVPEPCRVAPEVGQRFWAVNPFSGPQSFLWDGYKGDHYALDSGFVHLTEEAARQHYEAIKSLLEEK